MKKSLKFALLIASVLLLTACQSDDESEPIDIPLTPEEVAEIEDEVFVDVEPYEPVAYERSDEFLDNLMSGGPPPDGIPPIDSPEFITVKEAWDFYEDHEAMFLVELDGQVYLYPQSILVWHEIVNMSEHDVAVTYCPLTGSCITYEHPDHIDTTFGTSGNLLNSNLVMYDRKTGASISQIDGVGLEFDLEGYQLDTIPTHWIDWYLVKENYSDALVLSENTGFIRDYARDPYGSYHQSVRNNYYKEDGTIFPLLHKDDDGIFSDKHVVIGLKSGQGHMAIDKRFMKEEGIHYFEFDGQKYLAVYDEQLQNVRLYVNETGLNVNGDRIIDDAGNEWLIDGSIVEGELSLEAPSYFEVMWFAWHAFYPDTEVIK